jgi:hypothetical protein
MHSTHQKEVLMNIEKINKLYENMISLQELFEEEANPVDTINGLRFASAEFRHAFIKVRETLLKSPVSKQAQPTEKTETKKPSKSSKPSPKKTTKKATATATNTTNTTTKKKEDPLKDKFDEFILDSYDETSHDDLPKILTPIDEIIRMFALYSDIKLNTQTYAKFRKYLKNIYTADGDKVYLKPKSTALPNKCRLDTSGMTFYQHPKFKYLWCREDGTFYYLLPDGRTLKENKIIKNSRAMYLSMIGGKANHSARLLAFECYTHHTIPNHHVCVLNGNKADLSYSNLSISTMKGYKAPNNQYDEADAVLACEYIVAHDKDISNIESDTNYQIGYSFAKAILEKRRFENISNKYF